MSFRYLLAWCSRRECELAHKFQTKRPPEGDRPKAVSLKKSGSAQSRCSAPCSADPLGPWSMARPPRGLFLPCGLHREAFAIRDNQIKIATHARFYGGGICFRFLGSSALSIARLAAVIAASLLSDVPDLVSVSTDHFQRPRWIPWIIRYSTPRCSMLSLL